MSKVFLLPALIAVLCAGCCFHSDITKTAAVQRSGVLGLQFHTAQPLVLAKRKQSRVWRLMAKEKNVAAEGSHLRIVEAGTVLQVNRVIKVTELCEWMVFPVYFTWDCTVARIEDGPYAGKEIGIAGEGLTLDPGTVTLGSSVFRPVNQASMVSALYNMPDRNPPPPAKYYFYDSNSNQFATVTMVLPNPFFTDATDGLWFGDFANSYVRPKTERVLASDMLNVHDLQPLRCQFDRTSDPPILVNLNPDQPENFIILFMPFSETNGPVQGRWCYDTDSGTVDSGTLYGPVH